MNDEQLKRQLDQMRNCFTTATTQQDPYLSSGPAHMTTSRSGSAPTQCHTPYLSILVEPALPEDEPLTSPYEWNAARMLERLHAAQAYRRHRHCRWTCHQLPLLRHTVEAGVAQLAHSVAVHL